MKVYNKLFFILLSCVFLSGNLVSFINGADPVCCYSGEDITASLEGCGEGEIALSYNPTCNYNSLRRGCKVDDICYSTVSGSDIYNIDAIKTYFNDLGANLDDYCDELVVYDSNSCIDNYNIGKGGSNDNFGGVGGGSGAIGDTPVGVDPDMNDYTDIIVELQENAGMEFCSDAGGPFGMFLTNDSCEGLTNDGGQTFECIYDPYLAGKIGVFLTDRVLGIGNSEASCLHRTQFDICSDYKTKNNCVNNRAIGSNYLNDNLINCTWIETSSYYDDFVVGGGICISDSVGVEKNFNIDKYTSRLNVLKNPSFEFITDNNWSIVNNVVNIVNGDDAYNGNKYIRLLKDTSIEQTGIKFLSKGVSYVPLLYVKGNSSFISGDIIQVKIDGFAYEASLGSFTKNGIWYKVIFSPQQYITPSDFTVVSFSISSNVDIYIDAVSLERYDESLSVTQGLIFKNIEIIDSSASNCEMCFDDKNLNFCTEKKSDLMGDCSYMVNDNGDKYGVVVSHYLGEFDNYLMQNELSQWSSQSIANSKLFCEMYVNEAQCIDVNNYVNTKFASMHSLVDDGKLCKWSSIYGCYKKSDGNDLGPDVTTLDENVLDKSHLINLEYRKLDSIWTPLFSNFAFYIRESDESNNIVSDFSYGCDVMPPESYMYFESRGVDNVVNYVTSDFSDAVVGNVKFNLEAYDVSLESCENFNIDRGLYIDYVVTNADGTKHSFYRKSSETFISEFEYVQNFFIGSDNEVYFRDGVNTLEVIIKDQSGNVGKIRNFTMNIDLSGPNITSILSKNDIEGHMFGPNLMLEFNITDYTGVKSCGFELKPLSLGILNSDYDASGDFFNLSTNISNIYNFSVPIYNTTVSANSYYLTIRCVDVFGQEDIWGNFINVDFSTEFVLHKPLGFGNYLGDIGFLNSSSDVWITSTEELSSCVVEDYSDSIIDDSLSVGIISGGFIVDDYSNSVFFKSNVTGIFDFDVDGEKNISITCYDNMVPPNSYSETFIYYYDTQLPSLVNYSLVGISDIVVESRGEYYVISTGLLSTSLSVELNVSLDGTGSWIDNEFNLSSIDEAGVSYSNTLTSYAIELLNDSFIGNVIIRSFSNTGIYAGVEQGNGLSKYTYSFEFFDKAGNKGGSDISFYYDDSSPSLEFSGDISESANGDLYTSVSDPLLTLSFDSFDYRTFSCNLTTLWNRIHYSESYLSNNEFNIHLSDIITGFALSDSENNIELIFECVDDYGINLHGVYDLFYDNTQPVLSDVHFKENENIYLLNADEMAYGDILDKLVFVFNLTGESGYNCDYRFESTDYFCNSSVFHKSFSTSGSITEYETNLLNLIGDNSNAQNSICERDSNLYSVLNSKIVTEENYNTSITVNVNCSDLVGFRTLDKYVDLNVDYIADSMFVSFDVNYSQGYVEFVAKSLSRFSSVIVSMDETVVNKLTELEYIKEVNGVYEYKGSFPTSSLDDNLDSKVWVLGIGSDNLVWDKIAGSFQVDNIAPSIVLEFPDIFQGNNIFTSNFRIRMFGDDGNGVGLEKVELFEGNNMIFTSVNLSDYNDLYIDEPGSIYNYFTGSNDKSFTGEVYSKTAEVGDVFVFTLQVTDKAGNMNETNFVVQISDDFFIRLVDSSNAIADNDYTWITKVSKPVLSFETSVDVTKCAIYPMFKSMWIDLVPGASVTSLEQFGGTSFSFDLSDGIDGFDLNLVDDKITDVKLVCVVNGNVYNLTKTVSLFDMIPDYVLESSNGFVFSDGVYSSTEITIKSVGVSDEIDCNYDIFNTNYDLDGDELKSSFSISLDFSGKGSGEYDLVLDCKDGLGNNGPTKTYKFIVNNGALSIEDIELFSGNEVYELSSQNKFYVGSLNDINMKLKTNKRDVLCSYTIDEPGNLFSNILGFISNLFVDSSEDVSFTSIPFEFESSSGFSIDADTDFELKVECFDNDGGGSVSEIYSVNHLSKTLLYPLDDLEGNLFNNKDIIEYIIWNFPNGTKVNFVNNIHFEDGDIISALVKNTGVEDFTDIQWCMQSSIIEEGDYKADSCFYNANYKNIELSSSWTFVDGKGWIFNYNTSNFITKDMDYMSFDIFIKLSENIENNDIIKDSMSYYFIRDELNSELITFKESGSHEKKYDILIIAEENDENTIKGYVDAAFGEGNFSLFKTNVFTGKEKDFNIYYQIIPEIEHVITSCDEVGYLQDLYRFSEVYSKYDWYDGLIILPKKGFRAHADLGEKIYANYFCEETNDYDGFGKVITHEFGHMFGNLGDEYIYNIFDLDSLDLLNYKSVEIVNTDSSQKKNCLFDEKVLSCYDSKVKSFNCSQFIDEFEFENICSSYTSNDDEFMNCMDSNIKKFKLDCIDKYKIPDNYCENNTNNNQWSNIPNYKNNIYLGCGDYKAFRGVDNSIMRDQWDYLNYEWEFAWGPINEYYLKEKLLRYEE